MAQLRIRTILFFLMIVLSVASLITGLVLFAWQPGPRSGREAVLGLVKHEWSDWHTWLSVGAGLAIVMHMILNRKCVALYSKCVINDTTMYLEEALVRSKA